MSIRSLNKTKDHIHRYNGAKRLGLLQEYDPFS